MLLRWWCVFLTADFAYKDLHYLASAFLPRSFFETFSFPCASGHIYLISIPFIKPSDIIFQQPKSPLSPTFLLQVSARTLLSLRNLPATPPGPRNELSNTALMPSEVRKLHVPSPPSSHLNTNANL